jgi:hypothetical protein
LKKHFKRCNEIRIDRIDSMDRIDRQIDSTDSERVFLPHFIDGNFRILKWRYLPYIRPM